MGSEDAAPRLEIAHVLYMDLVGYSRLPIEEQPRQVAELQELVRATPEFRRAEAGGELIRLPTGDGMALVFFRDPVAPVQCAMQIHRALRGRPHLQLRIGLHSGPVYRVEDINANANVSGGGINLAQRVMECGDAGHILMSSAVRELLGQVGAWPLQDLGADAVAPLLSAASVGSEMLQCEVQIAHEEYQRRGKPRLLPIRLNFDDPLPGLRDVRDAPGRLRRKPRPLRPPLPRRVP